EVDRAAEALIALPGDGACERTDPPAAVRLVAPDRPRPAQDHWTASRKREVHKLIASGRVLSAARLTISREVTSATCSTSTRPFARKVAPVETRSTMRGQRPRIGASSIEPFSLMHSA